jgi:ribosomal protein S18 acetylase RimI-like enzyme
MQHLAREQRRLLGERAPWHQGDIAWGWRQHSGRDHEWRIRTWVDDGRLVAWSWLRTESGTLDFDVHRERRDLLDEILDEPEAREAWAFDDDSELRNALTRHGFTRPGESLHFHVRRLDEPPEPPALPDGFRYRTVSDADLAERVAVHRAAFAPSRVTEESYATVRATWPYRASLDCVVEAPDGRFAASALLWPDDENGVGELEPVGVAPAFRRRGFGAAVCTYALRRWRDEGGNEAVVYCVTDAACALYTSIGFRRHSTLVAYAR